MSQQIQQLFNAIAPKYDFLNSLLSFRIDRRWRRQAVEWLKGSEVREVLDLCAGTLALSRALLKANPHCHITALDFSKPMLDKGEKDLPPEMISRVHCLLSDVMTEDLPLQKYDGVMCAYGMRNIDDNLLVLKKIFSALKPGGRLVILDFFRPFNLFTRFFHATYDCLVIPFLGKMISRHPQAYQHLRDSIRNFYTPSDYAELLKKTGFQRITITPQTGGISCLIVAQTL